MKFAISTVNGIKFTMTIAPYYKYDRPERGIDKAKCVEHVKAIVGYDAIVVEVE